MYRLCKELQVLYPQRMQGNALPKKVENNHIVTGSNRLWQLDIVSTTMSPANVAIYVAEIIDVYDHSIVITTGGNYAAQQMWSERSKRALLRRNIHVQAASLVTRTDNGPQFTSQWFHDFCMHSGI